MKKGNYIILGCNNSTRDVSVRAKPYEHTSLEAAEIEAERLALQFPERSFIVVEVKGTAVKSLNPVEWK